MEKSLQIDTAQPVYFTYLTNILLALNIFFQIFPFYHGAFFIFYYMPVICFIYIVAMQMLGFEKFEFRKSYIFIYFIFSLWNLYGVLSFFWGLNHFNAYQSVYLKTAYFCNFYVITQCFSQKERYKLFKIIVYFGILFSFIISFYEIFTLSHLPTSKKFGQLEFTPTSAFFNENDFSSALLVFTPFFFLEDNKKLKLIANIFLVITLFIFMINGVRLALIFYIPFFLYFIYRNTSKLFKIVVILFILSAFTYIVLYQPVIHFWIKKTLREHVFSFGMEAESQRIGSFTIRANLLKLFTERSVSNYGIGYGLGNAESSIAYETAQITTGIRLPHNFTMEILVTEGIIGACCFLIIIFFNFMNKGFNNIRNNKNVLLAFFLLFFFFISSMIPSSIKGVLVYWIIIAYTYVLFDKKTELMEKPFSPFNDEQSQSTLSG